MKLESADAPNEANSLGWVLRRSFITSADMLLCTLCVNAVAQHERVLEQKWPVDLPNSKAILGPVPGNPDDLTSTPVAMAVSPDGHYLVTVNGGFGTFESGYMQSLETLDIATGKLLDFPEERTRTTSKQALFSGLAFSGDGRHLFAAFVSLTDPAGSAEGDTGSAIAEYTFEVGHIRPERTLKIPLQPLAPGRHTNLREAGGAGLPYPAAIAWVPGAKGDRLLIADELSDDALLMDAGTGQILTRYDLSENEAVPATYPTTLVVAANGRRAFVGLSNASEVAELDLDHGTVVKRLPILRPDDPVAPGSHPSALELTPDGTTLYVALANRDCVAKIDVSGNRFEVKGYIDTRLPGQSFFGAEPESIAFDPQGNRLYIADMASDSVAVVDPSAFTTHAARQGMIEPIGFVPTEWLPLCVRVHAGKLYVATGKGRGLGPNDFPQRTVSWGSSFRPKAKFTYGPTLIHGSLASIDVASIDTNLSALTETVLEANRMKSAAQKDAFSQQPQQNPIKHVIYIIKENRTYDQVLGDLSWQGKRVGNGDPALTMYGSSITPNQHALALQFGVLDNFMDSGEVSGQGHIWSIAAIGSDYLERSWPIDYRNKQHTYDYEGRVAAGVPLLQKIPDVVEPGSGYLWGNLAAHGKTYYHFGEYISSTFCNHSDEFGAELPPEKGAMNPEKKKCAKTEVRQGEHFPEAWGGSVSKFPWPIPLIANNTATKPELVGHFASEAPDFNLRVPDQVRVQVFLQHLQQWMADRQQGHDTMPNFILLHLPDDHTAGTVPGGPTPESSIADNDLGSELEQASCTEQGCKDDRVRRGSDKRRKIPANSAVADLLDLYRTLI